MLEQNFLLRNAGNFSSVSAISIEVNSTPICRHFSELVSGSVNKDYNCDEYLYPQRLALTSPTSGGRSIGIVRLRTITMEFSFVSYGEV
jgi:hypothetical protein